MAEKEDYYKILGVSKNSTTVEIKSAYRKKAMQYHPDRNPGNAETEELFKQVNEAYGVLSDDNKRQIYDTYGHEGMRQQGGFGGAGFSDINDIFNSVFSDMFGGGFGGGFGRQSKPRAQRGSDLKFDIDITLEEAFDGVEAPVNYKQTVECSQCGGTGAEKGTGVKTCPTCKGSGVVQFSQGFFAMRQKCPHCGGHGTVIEHPCKACRGTGRENIKKTLTVKVPPGVRSGVTLRVEHGGDAGSKGGPYGDLYIEVHVKPHKVFKRDGDDIFIELPVTFTQAALGDKVTLQNIKKEDIVLDIPAGTQYGEVLRVKDQGMTRLERKGRGDLQVGIKVVTPKKLSSKAKELLEELARETSVEQKGFFEKLFS